MSDRKLLSGSLRRVSLADVFQILGGNSFTGILNLRSQYSEFMGIIYFMNGNPINAYYGDLKGLDAIYAMFGWTDGNYEFYEQALKQIEPVVKQSRMQIVLNALRMLDDGEIKTIGPVAESEEINKEFHQTKKDEEKKSAQQPVESTSEHSCAGCKSLLCDNDTKVSIFGKEYCFSCAMVYANAMDGSAMNPEAKKEIQKEEISPKNETIKVGRSSATVIGMKKETPKNEIPARNDDLMNSFSPKESVTKDTNSNLNASRVIFLKDVLSEDASLKEVDSETNNSEDDESDMTSFEKIKMKFFSMGPFKWAVLVSIASIWIVLGILLFGKFNSSSSKLDVANQEKSGSSITANTTASGQANIVKAAVSQTTPAADNAAPAQNNASGQVKTAPIAENKLPPSAVSAQTTASQATEKKIAPIPTEKVEKQLSKETVVEQEKQVEKESSPTPVVKTVEEPATIIAKEVVKENSEPEKKPAEDIKPPEKIETAKVIPPSQEPVKEQTPKQLTPIKTDPEFPGGKAALMSWLKDHIKIPESAINSGVDGNVIIELTISPPNGKISNATIVKSLQKQCDQEVLRLVSQMPNWKPGEINGIKTISTYLLSVRFYVK